jgi:hypothetical protein
MLMGDERRRIGRREERKAEEEEELKGKEMKKERG